MAARIFQETKNAMQSGKAREGRWILAFESTTPRRPDPLTGWSGGSDTQTQVQPTFDTPDEAKAYAEREGVSYHFTPPTVRKLKLQSYADNFR